MMMSRCLVYQCSKAKNPDSSVTKSVTPSRCEKSFRVRLRSCGKLKGRNVPRKVCLDGRAWSLGHCSTGNSPLNRLRQYANCVCSSPCSQFRCQEETSAYWTGSSGRGEGLLLEKAS